MMKNKTRAFTNALWGSGLVGAAAYSLYASRNFADRIDDMCERCPNEGTNYDLSDSMVSAKICRECLREYQTSAKARELKAKKVKHHVIAYAHVYNGSAIEADQVLGESLSAEADLFAFTMAWLAEQVPRAGKTRADVIAAWEKVEIERRSVDEGFREQVKDGRPGTEPGTAALAGLGLGGSIGGGG